MSLVRSVPGILAGAILLLTSCESGPRPPAKGTPAFSWAAAKENFSAGDYVKTGEHLELITKTNNDFTARAWPWRLVIMSGIVAGYMDFADKFEAGMQANKNNPTPFRKRMLDARSMASQAALVFAESFGQFEKSSKDEQVPLAFSSPSGSATPAPRLNQLANGILPPPSEMDSLQRDAIRRGVLLASCQAAGAPNDPAKAADILKDGSATVSRPAFLRAMAQSFYDQAGVFGRRKLDNPDRRTFFLTRAGELAKQLSDSKENKEFAKKIEADLKAR
jgi:hypothetical protein